MAAAPAHDSALARQLDLSVLRYSTVWEDAVMLARALQPAPDDDILSIARHEPRRRLHARAAVLSTDTGVVTATQCGR